MTKKLVRQLVLVVFIQSLCLNATAKSKFYDQGLEAYRLNKLENAYKNFKAGYDAKDNDCTYFLGRMYDNGEFVNRDYALAKKIYEEAVKNGDAKANYGLAGLYKFASGVSKDEAKALEYYKLAFSEIQTYAEQYTNFFWQRALAIYYYNGYGVEKNIEKALSILQLSAEQGYNSALSLHGDWILEKNVKNSDDYKDAEWHRKLEAEDDYLKAINNGSTIAIKSLLKLNPDKLKQPDKIKYLTKGVYNNDSYCITELGRVYDDNKEFKNYKRAYLLFKRGSMLKNSACSYYLAKMYESGHYVYQDIDKAIEYYKLAYTVDSTSSYGLCAVAKLYYLQGKTDEAEKILIREKEKGKQLATDYLGIINKVKTVYYKDVPGAVAITVTPQDEFGKKYIIAPDAVPSIKYSYKCRLNTDTKLSIKKYFPSIYMDFTSGDNFECNDAEKTFYGYNISPRVVFDYVTINVKGKKSAQDEKEEVLQTLEIPLGGLWMLGSYETDRLKNKQLEWTTAELPPVPEFKMYDFIDAKDYDVYDETDFTDIFTDSLKNLSPGKRMEKGIDRATNFSQALILNKYNLQIPEYIGQNDQAINHVPISNYYTWISYHPDYFLAFKLSLCDVPDKLIFTDGKQNSFASINESLYASKNFEKDTMVPFMNQKEAIHYLSKSTFSEGTTAKAYKYKIAGFYSCITNANISGKDPNGPIVSFTLLGYLNKDNKTYVIKMNSENPLENLNEKAFEVFRADFDKIIQSFQAL